MAVNAGSMLFVGGRTVIDRLQSAGLGDVNTSFETLREVGNYLVVDKVPEDQTFTFSMESLDVSTDTEAWLCGKVAGSLASGAAPGHDDPVGTEYKWSDTTYVNVVSPWKDEQGADKYEIVAGHVIPGYFPTSYSVRTGVSDNAAVTVELTGGAYYYGLGAPVAEFFDGDGSQKTFHTSDPVVKHRLGGAEGTTFDYVWGVLVGKRLMTVGSDYTVELDGSGTAKIVFTTAPPAGTDNVQFTYITSATKQYGQAVHPDTIVKPGAVKGRNIDLFLHTKSGQRMRVPRLQSWGLNATVDSAEEREFGNTTVVDRTVNGRDVNGDMTVRARDAEAFIDFLSLITGVARTEVIGNENLLAQGMELVISNPKNPAQVLKTYWIEDAIVSVPGTPAQVNSPTDYAVSWSSLDGDFSAIKGARQP
jgi:hypothetical protein